MQFAVVQVLYRTNAAQFNLSIFLPVEPYDYLKSIQNYYNRHFGLIRTDMVVALSCTFWKDELSLFIITVHNGCFKACISVNFHWPATRLFVCLLFCGNES